MGKEINCPIWNTPAWLIAGSFTSEGVKMWSARTGGEYRYTNEAFEDFGQRLTDAQRALVTNWLVDQRRLGVKSPLLNADVMETVLKGRRLRFSERRERFWRTVMDWDLKPGEPFSISSDYASPELMGPRESQVLWAALGVETDEEGLAILKMLADEGYIDVARSNAALNGKAFEKLEAMSQQANGTQAFVAMWFDPTMKDAWRRGFAPAIRDSGYEPFRIDGLEHNGKIDDAIVAEIKKSRFLIADFTCGGVDTNEGFQPNPRGGVYYEAGLAHGLGMEVIFTCREDRMAWLHFDTRQFAHIVWKTPADLRLQLYNRIAATLKEASGAPGRGMGRVDPPDEE